MNDDNEVSNGSFVQFLAGFREVVVLIFLGLMVLIFSVAARNFDSLANWQNILASVAIVAIVGCGETLVVITRNIDISVGSVVGVAGYFSAATVAHDHASLAVALLTALGVGLCAGVINGVLVAVFQIPSIIATLALLGIGRGYDVTITGGQGIQSYELPNSFRNLGSVNFLAVPVIAWIAIAIVVITALGLHFARSCRELYIIGSNPAAARVIGIPVRRRLFAVFVLSGLLAGLGGFIYVAQYGSVDATAGLGFEFTVITAVVVGGIKLVGGSGTPVAAALGALLVVVIQDGFILLTVSQFWVLFLDGCAIVAAVVFDAVVTSRLQNSLTRGRQRGKLPALTRTQSEAGTAPREVGLS